MEHTWSLSNLASWRGKNVVAADGARVGHLESIVYDYKTVEPVWLGVGTGPLGAHIVLAPAKAAAADGDRIFLELTRDTLMNEPPVEIGEGWSYGEDALLLYDYFGVTYNEEHDIRVLHRHTELPGQERVIGTT
jgi:hypothetical protein